MPWILDALTMVIIGACALSAYRKGFLGTLTALLASLAALYLSLRYSQTIAELVYTQFFSDKIATLVAQHLSDFTAADAAAFAQGIVNLASHLPGVFSTALRSELAIYVEQWYQQLAGSSAQAMTVAITNAIIAPLAIGLLRVIVFCVMFGLFSMLGNAAARLFKTVNHLPLIGTFNALLGGVLGAIQGMLYVFVASAVLWFILLASGGQFGPVSSEMIGQTLIFKCFYTAGPWVNSTIKLI